MNNNQEHTTGKYTCPMHPEVRSTVPSKCPKCGMNLVLENHVKPRIHMAQEDKGLGPITWRSYTPLMVIIGLILLVTFTLGVKEGDILSSSSIERFMIGFFLVFGGFKLLDLKGFAEGYSTYDLLAKRVSGYGYVYPFVEIFFGLAMLLAPLSRPLLWAELLVMAFSGIGVAIKVAKKEEFRCVCLGTVLKVPLTTVTLIEDFGMALLAGILLILS